MGDLSDDTEERTCFVALLRERSEMPEIEVGRLIGTGETSSALLVLVDVGGLMFAALRGLVLVELGDEILGAAAGVGVSMLKSDAFCRRGGNFEPIAFGVFSEQDLIASKRESFRSSSTSPLGPAPSGVFIRGVRSVSELGEFDVGVSILQSVCYMVSSRLDIRENLAHRVHITQDTVLEYETSHSLIIIIPNKIIGGQQRTWWGFVDLLQQLEKYFPSLGKLGPCPLPPMWMSSTLLSQSQYCRDLS